MNKDFIRPTSILLFLMSFISCVCGSNTNHFPLKVSSNGRYFVQADGSPFIWMGDTAWELFHKLSREEADEYLQNRANKRFSVIQAVVLAENDGLRTANFYGHLPLINEDPTQINEAYFEHVDYIVNKAEELGLIIGMLPTWGDKLRTNNPGAGPVVFNKANAAVFGETLARRYKDKPIIWILGGDRNVDSEEAHQIWLSMAAAIKKVCGDEQLLTYHPRGASMAAWWFHNAKDFDFNMYQSGHERFTPIYDYASYNALLKPTKPFVDGEPAYEDISIRFWEYMDFSKPSKERVPDGVLNDDGLIIDRAHFKAGFVSDYDVRVLAYWNLLSGAAGYTYGNNAIWQMFKKGGNIAIPALTDWRAAMDRPGAYDMTHVVELLESRPYDKLQPDQSLIHGINPKGPDYVVSAIADDASYAYVYLSKGQSVRINIGKIAGQQSKASWFDPRTGKTTSIGVFNSNGQESFDAPTNGIGNDWLLILEAIK